MAKVTNFLSIALLVSVLAVVPAFGANGFCATIANKTHWVLDGIVSPVNWLDGKFTTAAREATPAVEAVAAVPAVAEVRDEHGNVTTPAVAAVEAVAAVPAVEAAPTSMNALYRTSKYLAVIGLIASSPAVLAAVNSLVSTIQSALGAAEDEADEATTEPTRLVIGRQA